MGWLPHAQLGCVFIGDRSPDEFGETILTRGYCSLYSRPSQLFIMSIIRYVANYKSSLGGRQWECEQGKAEHWRFGATRCAPVAGALVAWRYILRCAQLLATLITHGISRSVASPSSPSADARASWRTSAMRYDEPRRVWTCLTTTHE